MKTSIIKLFILGILIGKTLISCEKPKEDTPEPSEAIKKYLEIKSRASFMNSMNSLNSSNENADMSNKFMEVIGMSQLKNNSLDIEPVEGEPGVSDGWSPDNDSIWDYKTCAIITETENEDGTFTTIYDYGDGCDEWGSITKGKITYIWSTEGNTYYSKVIYENYYAYGSEMNGFSESSFTSDGNSYYNLGTKENTGSDEIMPDIAFSWSGASSSNEEMTIKYDTGEEFIYSSNYETEWNQNSNTVLVGEYKYQSLSEGYEYEYLVIEPIISSYECSETWIPVSGIESVDFKEGNETSHFTTDYGDGTCDNLATVTENGESFIVDFGKIMDLIIQGDGTIVNGDVTTSSPGKGF